MNFRSRLLLVTVVLGLTTGLAQGQSQNEISFPAAKDGGINFVMPSSNVGCTFTPQGGTEVYKPMDGGPELSCDLREPKYVRVVLTPKSLKRFDDVGDQGCCDASNPFAYGGRWPKEPFVCESAESGLTCKRGDGRGFIMTRERVELF